MERIDRGSWLTPGNWTLNGVTSTVTTPSLSIDSVVFNTTPMTVTAVPTVSIRSLTVTGNSTITLQNSAANATITVGGAAIAVNSASNNTDT